MGLHQAHLLCGKYNHNVFFIPTKASPNPVKNDYLPHHASIILQHKMDEMTAKSSEFACAASGWIWDKELNKMASYQDLIQHQSVKICNCWLTLGENELGRLFCGFKPNNIKGISVLNWIPKSDVPVNKKVTYPRYTVAKRPEKEEQNQTRITCGSDVLDYFGDVTTHTASMETIKIHCNSVLSTSGAKYYTSNISNMYLISLLPETKYVRFCYNLIPPRIIAYYNLDLIVVNGYVYACINRAWYGLKQGGFIAHQDLFDHLKQHGYVRAGVTDGLFKHVTHEISFTLVVNNFGIKYTNDDDVQHLVCIMNEKYTFKVNFFAN